MKRTSVSPRAYLQAGMGSFSPPLNNLSDLEWVCSQRTLRHPARHWSAAPSTLVAGYTPDKQLARNDLHLESFGMPSRQFAFPNCGGRTALEGRLREQSEFACGVGEGLTKQELCVSLIRNAVIT